MYTVQFYLHYFIPRCVLGYTGFQFWHCRVCRRKHFEHLFKVVMSSDTIRELNRVYFLNLNGNPMQNYKFRFLGSPYRKRWCKTENSPPLQVTKQTLEIFNFINLALSQKLLQIK